ncbi:unnamed protein product [Urochloa humidicola]
MREKHAAAARARDQDNAHAGAAATALDGIQYCSEHPYRSGSAAAVDAVAGGGICAFCGTCGAHVDQQPCALATTTVEAIGKPCAATGGGGGAERERKMRT